MKVMDPDEYVCQDSTDYAKAGVKKSLLVCLMPLLHIEGSGGALAVCIAGASALDMILLAATLDAIVERPLPSRSATHHLCLDKKCDNCTGYAACQQNYVPHIRRIRGERLDSKGQRKHPARRWVMERTFAWLSLCRAVFVAIRSHDYRSYK